MTALTPFTAEHDEYRRQARRFLATGSMPRHARREERQHGGYGHMPEYPVARAYIDMRASRTRGDTNETVKEIIARTR